MCVCVSSLLPLRNIQLVDSRIASQGLTDSMGLLLFFKQSKNQKTPAFPQVDHRVSAPRDSCPCLRLWANRQRIAWNIGCWFPNRGQSTVEISSLAVLKIERSNTLNMFVMHHLYKQHPKYVCAISFISVITLLYKYIICDMIWHPIRKLSQFASLPCQTQPI